jgi:hypothetical protein
MVSDALLNDHFEIVSDALLQVAAGDLQPLPHHIDGARFQRRILAGDQEAGPLRSALEQRQHRSRGSLCLHPAFSSPSQLTNSLPSPVFGVSLIPAILVNCGIQFSNLDFQIEEIDSRNSL